MRYALKLLESWIILSIKDCCIWAFEEKTRFCSKQFWMNSYNCSRHLWNVKNAFRVTRFIFTFAGGFVYHHSCCCKMSLYLETKSNLSVFFISCTHQYCSLKVEIILCDHGVKIGLRFCGLSIFYHQSDVNFTRNRLWLSNTSLFIKDKYNKLII